MSTSESAPGKLVVMDRTLIIGYGNPLRSDDAVGFLAAERLARTMADPAVTVMPLHQITPELAEPISRSARVIFIDACVGPEVGKIVERTVHAGLPAASAFTHHASPEGILAAALALYGGAPEAWLFSVAGADFSYSAEPSAALVRRVESVAAAVLRRIGTAASDRPAL